MFCRAVLDSRAFYQLAIPKLTSDDLELKGLWDPRATILTGRIVSLSESFYQVDIKTFACTNPRCRNNNHVIRHVGFETLEQSYELGPSQSKPEVFITSTAPFSGTKSKYIVKCHNCREDINELYPFRSEIEFKLAKLKVGDRSCFSINLLLVGSAVCSKVKLSNDYSLIGFPKLSAELPGQLKLIKLLKESYFFEVYGVDQEMQVAYNGDIIKQVLETSLNSTCDSLRLPILVLICQIIGSANGIHFNISLPGIDAQIMLKISHVLNMVFDSKKLIGSMKSNSVNLKILKQQKHLKFDEEIYPFLVNIVTKETKTADGVSFVYCNIVEDDQLVYIPVDLSLSEEADIILKELGNSPKLKIPKSSAIPILSESCVKNLQEHFLTLRGSKITLPLKFSLNILTKFALISAISYNKNEADAEDAEFAVMIHSELMMGNNRTIISDHIVDDCLMSPSVSFDSCFTPKKTLF